MAFHGWGETADRLRELARTAGWGDMPSLISDEMLQTFAVTASLDGLGAALRARYSGLADRLTLYLPFSPGDRDEFWSRLARDVHTA
jgi:hypothetical protein